jgi:peptidoglycan/xylan/chitin deacetylase (PgdA/CDA1 family)
MIKSSWIRCNHQNNYKIDKKHRKYLLKNWFLIRLLRITFKIYYKFKKNYFRYFFILMKDNYWNKTDSVIENKEKIWSFFENM